MAYTTVDPVIRAWAAGHGLTVSTEFGGKDRRFCYVTGGPQECFQVSIEPPEGPEVLVNLWSTETIDDAELHASWRVSVEELSIALDLAFNEIAAWTERPKGTRTGQSPTKPGALS